MTLLQWFSRAGDRASVVAERYIPEAWVVCMMLTLAAFLLAVFGAGVPVTEAVTTWGQGMWGLLTITMQFALAVLAAYACVMSPLGFKAFDALARVPNPDKPWQAVLTIALLTTFTGYLNWALCFVASALFIPFLARRNPRADIRVLAAGGFMGVGTVTNAGLSGSAPLIMATPGNPLIAPVNGQPVVERLYPVTETVFSSFNLLLLVVVALVSIGVIIALHPRGDMKVVTYDPERLKRVLPTPPELPPAKKTPAGWIENNRFWSYFAGAMILFTLGHNIATKGFGASWNINAYNAVFLGLALLLHGNPLSFVHACRRGLDAAWGIVIQFPFYGGIFGLMTATALGKWLGGFFVQFSSAGFFPWVVYSYSAVMNFFVPSSGSKWMIEAPYILSAAGELGVSHISVLLAYVWGDSLTNLIHPYMAIPIMAITGLKFGEFAGYSFFVGVALFLLMSTAMLLMPLQL